jgi:hypothetical protein
MPGCKKFLGQNGHLRRYGEILLPLGMIHDPTALAFIKYIEPGRVQLDRANANECSRFHD